MGKDCLACRAGLDHCHGTLVHHASHRCECTEDDCVMPEIAHAFTLDCDAIGCVCGQPMGSAEVSSSSAG